MDNKIDINHEINKDRQDAIEERLKELADEFSDDMYDLLCPTKTNN